MQQTTEVFKTSGVVEAVTQDDKRYGIKVGGEWYGAFGTCPAEKGAAYVIGYVVNGEWKNIKSIQEQGRAVSERIEEQRSEIQEGKGRETPVLSFVKNYRTDVGWQQSVMTRAEDAVIQQAVRKKNNEIFAECLEDAEGNIEAAIFLAERRIVHVSKIYDEFLKAKVEAERRGESPSASEVEEGN